MTNKKILITGGSGFVGLNVLHQLVNTKFSGKIYNLSRTPVEFEMVQNIVCPDAVSFDFSLLKKYDFDYVINLLALSHNQDCINLSLAQKINIDFSKNLFEFCLKRGGIKKIIHLSSAIIYDNNNQSPVSEDDKLFLNYSNYSFTKGISDYYANFYEQKFNLPLINFRLSNIYGPYQKLNNSPFLIPGKIIQALKEGKIEVFNLQPRRDWIYSEDAALAIIKALDSEYNGTLNLASGQAFSVEEIVKTIAKKTGVEYKSLDKEISGPLDFYCDVNRIKAVLNWQASTSLEDGVNNTIQYIKDKI